MFLDRNSKRLLESKSIDKEEGSKILEKVRKVIPVCRAIITLTPYSVQLFRSLIQPSQFQCLDTQAYMITMRMLLMLINSIKSRLHY